MKQLYNKFLCCVFGHKEAVTMLIEDEYAIYIKGCPRCKTHLGFPATWKNCPPPPNSNEEQIKSWNEFRLRHYEEVRASVNNSKI